MSLKQISEVKVSGGRLLRVEHLSAVCNGSMTFAIFLPPQAKQVTETKMVPVLYWLSGLTCNDENFSQKAGAFSMATKLGMAIVMPDTSPRDAAIGGEDEAYDLGTGAGFYVNATQAPWSDAYNMYSYVTEELPSIIQTHYAVSDQAAISGHSMGGHGALICALKNPGKYASVSAFAPITSPSQCPWGRKGLTAYLGSDEDTWADWDASHLVQKNHDAGIIPQAILIDQGASDPFYADQLMPELFNATCERLHHPVDYREREGYDHSYYYISSFIDEHLQYHAANLGITA
ncbi:MAG: S-formylglutathione hydrolase [Pseudomonadales bacterium]|jgi:S-formylglutathione hydrolase|tara:strand:- start:4506 stop:5375 length:870 start_codon:yes stop_codon:yes gene_type:complete